jgi:pimeloyl-ACP methyl ester carboxylesterase
MAEPSEIAHPAPRPRKCRLRRWLTVAIAVFAIAFIGLNFIAFMQARAMIHFAAGGARTQPPERLSRLQKLEVLFTGVRLPRPTNRSTPAVVGLTFQTIRFGGATSSDCEAWQIPCPGAKAVCLEFPPYTAPKAAVLAQAREFHNMGYDVLMVDFHGVGGSVGDRTTLGYEEAGDVATASAYARQHWPAEQQILYGPSMAGAAVLRAAAMLDVHPSAIIIESTFDTLLSTAENRFRSVGIPTFPSAELLVFWGGVQLGYNGFNDNPVEWAQNVKCPVLMFQGSRDLRVTDAQATNLYNHLAGPRQMEVFDCGHVKFLAQDPDRWRSIVSQFLKTWVH